MALLAFFEGKRLAVEHCDFSWKRRVFCYFFMKSVSLMTNYSVHTFDLFKGKSFKINWKITATLKIILFSTFRLSMQSFSRKETTKRRRWMEKFEHTYLKREMYTERFEKREKLDEFELTMRGDREKLMRHSQWEREKKHDDVVRRWKHVLIENRLFYPYCSFDV